MLIARVMRGRWASAGLHNNSLARLQYCTGNMNTTVSSVTRSIGPLQSRNVSYISTSQERGLCSSPINRIFRGSGRCHYATSASKRDEGNGSSFNFFTLNKQDFDEVSTFVNTYFFPLEPLTTGAHCKGEVSMDDMIMKTVCSGVSVGVRDKATGELVGVRLSSIMTTRPQVEPPPDSVEPGVAKVINMLNHLWEAVDVFDDPGVEKIMKSDILTVHTGYNGKGLAKKMVEWSENLALNEGCHLLYSQPTNLITAKIFGQRGYDVRYTLDLDTFLDEDGQRVFDTSVMFGNNVIRVMSKRVI